MVSVVYTENLKEIEQLVLEQWPFGVFCKFSNLKPSV